MGIEMPHEFHMWFMLGLTAATIFAFVREKITIEIISIILLTILLLYGQIFSVVDENGKNLLNADDLLAGFSNSSLIAVLALLVVGQGMIHTDSLRYLTGLFVSGGKKTAVLSIFMILLLVCVVSGVMNNTPLVIIAIPIFQALSSILGVSPSRVMMPLSFAAILGGMTTLVGSSTNLLVSTAMVEQGFRPLGFFEFTVPGAILAISGFIYVVLVVPFIMPKRASISEEFMGDETEFVAELDIAEDSKLVGSECVDGKFSGMNDLNVKLIQRGGHLILPPFEGYSIRKGDIVIVTASRKTLGEWLLRYPGFMLSEEEAEVIEAEESPLDKQKTGGAKAAETRVLAKIMITPASRMVDMSLEHINFHKQFGAIVLGIQRRARAVRRRLGRIRLEAGDVLLVAGKHSLINNLRGNPDFIVLSGSKIDLPSPGKAPLAILVFLTTISMAATGVLTIPVAAFAGAAAMLGTGCLNIRQATRAIDRKVFLLVGSTLALGTALGVTGGIEYLANSLLLLPVTHSPLMMISLLFLLIAITTNVLSNNACAILFTPIALRIAEQIQDPSQIREDLPYIFAISVVFAANCSFASPIGYQTNLLVMGPGQYRFRDFMKAGVPLIFVLWVSFVLIAKYYYGLS